MLLYPLQQDKKAMGGVKKKTLAGMEKEQARKEAEEREKERKKEKGKTKAGGAQPNLTFSLKDEEVINSLKGLKAITIHAAAKAFNVKTSVAAATLKSMEAKGLVKKVGGFSGHYVYSLA